MSTVERVPAAEWSAWADDRDATVLDVREPHEWQLGCLPGAVKIRMGEIVLRHTELDTGSPVLVVCRSGGRSLQVAAYLASLGYRSANLEGGMKALGLQD